MLPVIALVGRPNVGKSTLFNILTRSRDALVADFPGLTRDRQYGLGQVGPQPYLAVDTGGLMGETEGLEGLEGLIARQARRSAPSGMSQLLSGIASGGRTSPGAATARRAANRIM